MFGKFAISSFNSDILTEVERVRARNEGVHPRFDILYLYNHENNVLPSKEEYTGYGDGINISANHLTLEVFENCKSKGLKVGVWIRAKDF
jgi:hypothetical protein